MRELFDVAELVRIGIDDETSGVAFYGAMASKTANARLKELFADLARQEGYHKRRFEEMLETMKKQAPHEEYAGEYMAYLKELINGRAIPDEQAAVRLAFECKDDAEAIELATRFERDTLILMGEMRSVLPDRDRAIVAELAREEQSHLVALAGARTILGK